MNGMKVNLARIFGLAVLVFTADQVSKQIVANSLLLGESRPVIDGVFHFSYLRNPGAAFGILPDHTEVLLILTLYVLAAIVYLGIRIADDRPMLQVALGLVLGGTLGNFSDRVLRGGIVDFLDFRVWPVFNIADMALVIGAALLLVGFIPATSRLLAEK